MRHRVHLRPQYTPCDTWFCCGFCIWVVNGPCRLLRYQVGSEKVLKKVGSEMVPSDPRRYRLDPRRYQKSWIRDGPCLDPRRSLYPLTGPLSWQARFTDGRGCTGLPIKRPRMVGPSQIQSNPLCTYVPVASRSCFFGIFCSSGSAGPFSRLSVSMCVSLVPHGDAGSSGERDARRPFYGPRPIRLGVKLS